MKNLGILTAVIALIGIVLASLPVKTLLALSSLISMGILALAVFFCFLLETWKERGTYVVAVSVIIGILSITGYAIGFDWLLYLGFSAEIITHTYNWILYPFVGLVCWSGIFALLLLYCALDEENTVKGQLWAFMQIILSIIEFAVIFIGIFKIWWWIVDFFV